MQISLNIKDEVYKKLVGAGVDMQSRVNDYLTSLVNSKDTYIDSKQFREDKKHFNDRLESIKSGEATLMPHSEVWEEIDKHTSSH